MSRSGYVDDYDQDDQWGHIRYRGMIASATRGKRGQAFFRDLLAALDAMPAKRLIRNDLIREDSTGYENVCTLGALGRARRIDMTNLDPDDAETVAGKFDIATPLAREVVWENDEAGPWRETPEARWLRVRTWVASQIKEA
ncbi:hypothetical protein [Methylobacterium fujisawaense]|uniref:hypothetical protein n=1 Tax=Methylobacterium fujisawaense TaxID=107400 RepID=UPI00313ED6D3